MVAFQPQRILLRADLEIVGQGDRKVVAYTVALSPEQAVISTEERLPAGEKLVVRLSFGRLLSAILLDAVVVGEHDGGSPHDLGGLTLRLVPRAPADADALDALLRPPSQPTRARRVLLVEDNPIIRDLFSYGASRIYQERPGAPTIEHAEDGERAWNLLQERDYDILIVDYYLPGLDGAQLVARARGQARLADLPVIAISVGGTLARAATLAAGADLYIDKPVVLRDLFGTLERLPEARA